MFPSILCFHFVVAVVLCDVEVTVDGGEGAYFLRPEVDGGHRFALIGGARGAPLLRARFGPFTAEESLRANANDTEHVTARLVTREVRRDRPVLRVLFQRTSDTGGKGSRVPCVLLYVHRGEQHLMAACSPGDDGVCLAQATLPVSWWPALHPKTGALSKPQRTRVLVEYAVLPPAGPPTECADPSALPVSMASGLPPGTPLGEEVALVGGGGAYEEVGADDVVRILVPQGPVYPGSKVYVPVHVRPDPVYPPYVFVIRARVKSGLRIVGAQVSPSSEWSISVELNPRQTIATVTAFVKDTSTPLPSDKQPLGTNPDVVQEVFTWLLEVEEGASPGDGRVAWQLRYLLDASMAETYDFEDDADAQRIASRLDIRKDDVHALVPIAQWSQVLNTAVLTGRQVSQPMKVFVVSQAGKVGDVTLQSSCTAADESILKVSPSCTSVYVDGSEVRGSQDASVQVRYGSHSGSAKFVVWMPELPLSVRLSDSRLAQIKGWRTPHPHRGKSIPIPSGRGRPSARNDRWLDREPVEDTVCRLRFQQSSVEVYVRFVGADHDSGREAFLLGRRAELRVTDLVTPFLRVADPRVARLARRTVLQGMQAGRTEVQVLSPITGRVMGAREVRVGGDRETITHLEVGVVTGLLVSASPDSTLSGVFVAHAHLLHKLTSQYQEGVLDIHVHFSDGTSTALSDISDLDYHLSVDTFDGGVVAFAPVAGSPRPRVVAVGKGRGELLHATLELAERCRKRRSQPLSMAYADVDVDFGGKPGVLNDVQRKSKQTEKKKTNFSANPGGEEDADENNHVVSANDVSSILYQDAVSHRAGGKAPFREPAVQARQNLLHPSQLTPLEIGMYALLGVFCLAILVFLVSCSVFAVRYRRKQEPEVATTTATTSGDSVAHAHDWVWLGRATLERNSVNTRCSQTLLPTADFNGNHPSEEDPADDQAVTGRGGKRGGPRPTSNVSFPGSEVSIRITTNPQELREDEMAMMDKATSTSPPTMPRERRVRIIAPPPLAPTNGALRLFPAHNPPPIPPHRNLPPNQRLHRLRGHATDAEWEAVSGGMDYDQLIEYFENLKESNA